MVPKEALTFNEFPADLVIFTKETLNKKLNFLCSVNYLRIYFFWVQHSDMYKMKQPLEVVPREKVLLKFENIKGDE